MITVCFYKKRYAYPSQVVGLTEQFFEIRLNNTKSHLKIKILVQGQGGAEVQPSGILKYFEELKRGTHTEIGAKDFFEIASYQSNIK